MAVESNWEQDWGSELEGGIQEDEFENEEFGGGRIPSLSRLTMSSEGPGIAPPPSAVAKPQGGSNYVTFSKELSSAGMSIDGLSRLPSALSSDKVLKSAPMKQAHKGVASTDMAVRQPIPSNIYHSLMYYKKQDLGLGSWDHDDLSLQDIELK